MTRVSGASPQPEAEELIEPETPPAGETAQADPRAARRRAAKRRRRLRVLGAVLAGAAYAVLAFCMFRVAMDAEPNGTAASLRYSVPVGGAAAASAKFAAGDPEFESPLSATYWYESPSESIQTVRGAVNTPAVFVDGEASRVLRGDFLFGDWPAALETHGLAMSEGLAWALFGGPNAVGEEIEWHGAAYTVRGVFAGDEPLLLAQVDAADAPVEGFQGVELAGLPEGDPREAAAAYAREAGLPEADQIVAAGTLPAIISAMAWVPAALLCLWLLCRVLVLLRRAAYWQRALVWLVLGFGAAMLIPRALEGIPAWVIPNQWSDFDHWGALYKELNARLGEWLSMRPFSGDVRLKRQLILQAVLLVPTLFSAAALMQSWGHHMRRARVDFLLRPRYTGGAGKPKGSAAAGR